MNNVGWYTRNHANHYYELTQAEANELAQRKRKLMYALRKQEREARAAYKLEHSKGYCPKCHCLLPLSGVCDCE